MDERHRLVLLHLQRQTESDRLADCLYKVAEQILKNQVIRTDYARDGDPDSDVLFSYTSLIINVIVHPFSAFSIASMASVLAFSVKSMEGHHLFVVYTEESAKWHIYISPISLTVEVSSAVLATSNFTRNFLRYHFTVSGLRPRQSAICGVV